MKHTYQNIARTLKDLRETRGWSLDKTAEKTGVSKAMLGQIERKESSPTIATLWKIASGFDVSFSSFLEPAPKEQTHATHQMGKKSNFRSKNETIHVTPLFPYDPKLKSEIFIIDLLPKNEHRSPAHQKGVIEHILPINGNMEVLVDQHWTLVKKGEGLRFAAEKPHGYRNTTRKTVRFHLIIHYL